MKPDPARVLQGVAINLALNLGPEVSSAFGKTTVEHAAGLLMVLAIETDRLADRLQEENVAVATLLRDARSLVAAPLTGRIDEALAASAPKNIRVSTLQQVNDRLRAALIEVHTAVESLDGAEAAAMDERIWHELRESAHRRHLDITR